MKKNKSSIIVLIVLAVLVILTGAWFWYTSSKSISSQDVSSIPQNDVFVVQPNDNTKGNPQAKAVLIEYGDFQCIACKYMHERFRLIWRVVKDDIYLVYRHFPLSQHAHARMAARYSEAMSYQGKFWPFHDLLYDRQQVWENLSSEDAQRVFDGLVKQVGGNLEKVKKDLQDPAIDKKIDEHVSMGSRSGLRATPTLFLNGVMINIPNDLSEFVSQIKELNQP